jgi:ABC-2 type transport system permease protein/lipopolysaccharide transport system permease protein
MAMTRPRRQPGPYASTLRDLWDGWRRRELWLALGSRDVRQRFRRSLLGPLWIPIHLAILAAVMGTLYSSILQRDPGEYIPYLVTGFIGWNLLSSLVIDGCQAFTANAAAIKEVSLPNTVHVFQIQWRNVIVFAHQLVIYLILVVAFQLWPTGALLLVVPGILLVVANGMWVGLLLGMLNTRFRDIGQLVGSAMRIMFFVTPVIWHAELAGARSEFVYFNPFYYFLEVIRAPMLGTVPDLEVWLVVLAVTAAGWIGTVHVYARYSWRIPYWV